MKKRFLFIFFIIILLFSLSACGNNEPQTEVIKEETPKVDYGQYAKIEIEPKKFTYGSYDLIYTNKTFPSILNDFELILSTTEEINNFPQIKDLMTIKNTNPQLVIIPKYFQIQYHIEEITCKNGVITITYKTENNPKIDRVIGQIYEVPYTVYYIDLGILPNGKYRVEFKDKDAVFEDTIKDINIFIPELITKWDVKNINFANNNYITYASNQTGNWQVYRYNLITKENIQISSHNDSVISGYNDLGFNNNINIPTPRYNHSLNSIYYAINSDIYRYEDLGDNIFRKFNISLENMQTNMPNEYYIFEKKPVLSNSGYKYLFADVSDPMHSLLYVGETFDQGKKENVQLPVNGIIEYFDWGRNENEYIVAISPNSNERMNGNSSIWLIKENGKNIQITTNGYKINSLDTSNNKDFIIFSQKLASTEGNSKYDLYYVNTNDTNLKRITPKDDRRDINPAISPNNSLVAYMSSPGNDNYELFVANIDGSNRRKVSDFYITDTPYWLNNEEILIVDPFANIIRINVNTGDNEVLIDGFDKLDIEAEQAKLEELKFSN